jgi:hypothetical protein
MVAPVAQPRLWWASLIAALGLTLLPPAQVLTPGGMRPRALVHTVEPGQALQQLGEVVNVVDMTGEIVEGKDVLLQERPLLEAGWIAFTWWTNDGNQPLTSFSTTWRVPEPPATDARQTIFLFNGLQNSGPNYGILQPVLQWGPSAAGGGSYWTVASWYVTSRGQAFHTPLQRVEPGQTLVGEMQLLEAARGKYTWSCELVGVPRTRLLLRNVAELKWSTESLEAYNVERCSDYPAALVEFSAIRMQTDVHPEIRWTPVDRVTDCDQHAEVVSHSSTDGRVDLRLRRR